MSNSKKGKIIVMSDVLADFQFLHLKYQNLEWSGLMFGETSGSIKGGDFVFRAEKFRLYDLGSAAYTSFKIGDDLTDTYINEPELIGKKIAFIHSHHHMATNPSGTDTTEMTEQGENFPVFVSLIVNHNGVWNCRASYREKKTVKYTVTEDVMKLDGSVDIEVSEGEETVDKIQIVDLEIEPSAPVELKYDIMIAAKRSAPTTYYTSPGYVAGGGHSRYPQAEIGFTGLKGPSYPATRHKNDIHGYKLVDGKYMTHQEEIEYKRGKKEKKKSTAKPGDADDLDFAQEGDEFGIAATHFSHVKDRSIIEDENDLDPWEFRNRTGYAASSKLDMSDILFDVYNLQMGIGGAELIKAHILDFLEDEAVSNTAHRKFYSKNGPIGYELRAQYRKLLEAYQVPNHRVTQLTLLL